jgi:hypothetical protein
MATTRPPDVPPSVPQPMADYLRRLGLWAFQEIDKKISRDEGEPHVMLYPSDQKPPKAVFSITVDSAGTIAVNPVTLGTGKP